MLRLAALRLARRPVAFAAQVPRMVKVTPRASQPPLRRWNSSATLPPQEPRLSLTFTCTANACGHRSSHEFTRQAYEHGVVFVTCPSCKNRHVIADHLGWFKEAEGMDGGRLRTVEDILRARGESVDRGRMDPVSGVLEYYARTDADGDPK